ncbi:MAG: amidohydrolase [Oscillospiraceae bacterium]
MCQTIYYNGNILTMEKQERAQALLEADGIIRAVGTLETVRARADSDARLIDLDGRTLMPAFLDAHGHLTALAATRSLASLSGINSREGIVQRLQEFAQREQISPGAWVIGFGYDHNLMTDGLHPDRHLLDTALPDNPVLITHASGHMGVASTAALHFLNLTSNTADCAGGHIGREEDGTPSGYLEERAFFDASARMPAPATDRQEENLLWAQKELLRHGIATAQEGLVCPGEWSLLESMSRQEKLLIDVIGYVDLAQHATIYREHPEYHQTCNHLRLGGYKLFLDGSPQGKTAWLTCPYEGSDERGYPIHSDEALQALVETACSEGVQLLVHCNGDAAAEQLLVAMERAARRFDVVRLRPVMIHAQTVRADQLERMGSLGMIPSFFVSHTWYWGDTHRKNLGTRANSISPVHTALGLGLPATLHLDTPVLPPDPIDAVWCAVNRLSRGGVSMGEAERVTVQEALRCVTLHAAWQCFEEEKKGSIRAGKHADFVLLDADPTAMRVEDLRALTVTETVVRGETLYRA